MTTKPGASAPSIARPETASQGSGFAKVFGFLREQWLEGAIRNGDRLLLERELALQLGVSQPIVREALRTMSVLGVVEIRARVGTAIAAAWSGKPATESRRAPTMRGPSARAIPLTVASVARRTPRRDGAISEAAYL